MRKMERALVREEDLVGGPRWHGFYVDDVAVIIVQHRYVIVAGGGTSEEAAGLISVDLASCLVIYCLKSVD